MSWSYQGPRALLCVDIALSSVDTSTPPAHMSPLGALGPPLKLEVLKRATFLTIAVMGRSIDGLRRQVGPLFPLSWWRVLYVLGPCRAHVGNAHMNDLHPRGINLPRSHPK
jgi:hypothetical protein